jgi:hypothetical protein
VASKLLRYGLRALNSTWTPIIIQYTIVGGRRGETGGVKNVSYIDF